MEDVIEQMKRIQSRIGLVVSDSNQQNQSASNRNEVVGGEGIEVKSDGGKVSISQQQQQQQQISLPSGSGVLGIDNGVLFVYGTTECS
jgi:hypothetical protein